MITENGIVTQANAQTAWVKTTRSAACESCSEKDSCGTSHHGSQEMTVIVKNTLNVKTGDAVVIGIETKPMLILSFMLYVFPIILLIIGAGIGNSLAPFLKMDESVTSMVSGFSRNGGSWEPRLPPLCPGRWSRLFLHFWFLPGKMTAPLTF